MELSGQPHNEILFSENTLYRMHEVVHEHLLLFLKPAVQIFHKIIEIDALRDLLILHHRVHIRKGAVCRIHMTGRRDAGIHSGAQLREDLF